MQMLKSSQNGWTKERWNTVEKHLNTKYDGASFTVSQLKDREQRLKKEHNVIRSILEKSGFGWDPVKGVPTAPDKKWDELSKELRKWRHIAFPHYDALYEIYEGKIAEGKCCKRTTDSIEERYNMSQFPEQGSYTDEVLRAAGLESPEPTLPAPGSSMAQYDWNRDIYGKNIDLSYREHTEQQFLGEEDYTRVESPRRKRLRNSKGSNEGSEKTKAKNGKDTMLEDLVSVRKDELKTYKEIKMAQMKRNDPKNNPYGMPNCIWKLKKLGLTPSERHKINRPSQSIYSKPSNVHGSRGRCSCRDYQNSGAPVGL